MRDYWCSHRWEGIFNRWPHLGGKREAPGQEKDRQLATKVPSRNSFFYSPSTKVSGWLQLTTVTGTLLSAIWFCGFYVLIITLTTHNLQTKYNSFLLTYCVHYTLSCINGGIVIARHNEIRDYTIHLARQEFSPNCVRGKPLINQGRSISDGEGALRQDHSRKMGSRFNPRRMWELDRSHYWLQFRICPCGELYDRGKDKLWPRWRKIEKDKHG